MSLICNIWHWQAKYKLIHLPSRLQNDARIQGLWIEHWILTWKNLELGCVISYWQFLYLVLKYISLFWNNNICLFYLLHDISWRPKIKCKLTIFFVERLLEFAVIYKEEKYAAWHLSFYNGNWSIWSLTWELKAFYTMKFSDVKERQNIALR